MANPATPQNQNISRKLSRAGSQHSKMVALNQTSNPPTSAADTALKPRKTPPDNNSFPTNRMRSLLRARYYDPHTAEFLSPDPLEYVDGMSLFRGYFVGVGVDPFGAEFKECRCSTVFNSGSAVGGGVRNLKNSWSLFTSGNCQDACCPNGPIVSESSNGAWSKKTCNGEEIDPPGPNLDSMELWLIPCCECLESDEEKNRCMDEIKRIIERLRNCRKNIIETGGAGLGIRGRSWNNCSECELKGQVKGYEFFEYETVLNHGVFNSGDAWWRPNSHAWGQLRCRASGKVVATIDFWTNVDSPCTEGMNGNGWTGDNQSELEKIFLEKCKMQINQGKVIPPYVR